MMGTEAISESSYNLNITKTIANVRNIFIINDVPLSKAFRGHYMTVELHSPSSFWKMSAASVPFLSVR
jgi:hypothetical protein